MSGRQYTVAIKLVDKDGIMSKLGNLGKGSSPGTSGGGGSGVLDKIAGAGAGQLLKLTGIGLGIAELVRLGVKSSGILQQNFKLWETSMMLIFRPITDFIGLILRPFTLLFLQWFVIPFYQKVYPFFREWGTAIGKFFADPKTAFSVIVDAIAALGAIIAGKMLTGGGGGGTPAPPTSPGANPSAPTWPKCIELCNNSTTALTKPLPDGVSTGIGQSLLVPMLVGIGAELIVINSTQLETNNAIKNLSTAIGQALKIPELMPAGKKINVDINDKLGVSDTIHVPSIDDYWNKATISSATVATQASMIAQNFEAAAKAISEAIGRLDLMSTEPPWVGGARGGGNILPRGGAGNAIRLQMAGMAEIG